MRPLQKQSPPGSSARTDRAPGSQRHRAAAASARFRDVLELAQNQGLLQGSRDTLVRGRMPRALVKKAKSRVGIESDTKLIELALANLAVADDYTDWLLSQRASIPQDFDLEF